MEVPISPHAFSIKITPSKSALLSRHFAQLDMQSLVQSNAKMQLIPTSKLTWGIPFLSGGGGGLKYKCDPVGLVDEACQAAHVS